MSELFVKDQNGHYVGPDGKARKMKASNYGLLGSVKESRDIDVNNGDVSINEDVDIRSSIRSINEQKRPDELQLV